MTLNYHCPYCGHTHPSHHVDPVCPVCGLRESEAKKRSPSDGPTDKQWENYIQSCASLIADTQAGRDSLYMMIKELVEEKKKLQAELEKSSPYVSRLLYADWERQIAECYEAAGVKVFGDKGFDGKGLLGTIKDLVAERNRLLGIITAPCEAPERSPK
jgi:uncharacterized Zn finger protein (UPF0148 family)